MNRSPRRTVRIQPPLRGRLAAVASPAQKQRYSEPVVRKHPAISKSKRKEREYIPPSTPTYKLWQLLLGLLLLIILSFCIGNLFFAINTAIG